MNLDINNNPRTIPKLCFKCQLDINLKKIIYLFLHSKDWTHLRRYKTFIQFKTVNLEKVQVKMQWKRNVNYLFIYCQPQKKFGKICLRWHNILMPVTDGLNRPRVWFSEYIGIYVAERKQIDKYPEFGTDSRNTTWVTRKSQSISIISDFPATL